MTVLLYILGALLFLFGMVGLILPGLPGSPFLFLGVLVVAWADDFERIGAWGLVVMALLALMIFLADWVAQVAGARRFGASYWGLIGAALGLLAGVPFGLPGILLGPVVGAVALELLREPDLRRASRVGAGTLIGFVLGTAVKYALALVMVGLWLFLYFF